MTLTLSPETEKMLRETAARQGITPDALAEAAIKEKASAPVSHDQQPESKITHTLAEALAGHIGTQHSGRGDLSQNTGKAFTRLMVEKRKEGRL